jgi:hypothetical protein
VSLAELLSQKKTARFDGYGYQWFVNQFNDTYSNFLTAGLVFDIVGAKFLATGYLELMIQANSGFGGGGSSIDKYMPKHFRNRVFGLLFLILGFTSQGLANILSNSDG